MLEFESMPVRLLARAPRGTIGVYILNRDTTFDKVQRNIQAYFTKSQGKVSTNGEFMVDPKSNRTRRVVIAKVTKQGRQREK